MMFLFHTYLDFFLLTDTFQRLEANVCENTSFFQLETRTIVLHSANLNMCEMTSYSFHMNYRTELMRNLALLKEKKTLQSTAL